VYGQEADDEIGIASTADPDSIIVTIDKDLDQLPRWHYNFVKKERYSVSELGAIRNFYLQVLEGDNGDDVKGCPKIGKAKSMRYLEGCENEPEMLRVVLGLYEKHHDDEWLDHLLLAGKLLWLRRYPNQPWTLTNGEAASKESLVKHSSNFEFPTTMSQEQLTM
jgi:5'-3' exonuclease